MQIKPIFKDKNALALVFSLNDKYAKFFAVALKSLIENSSQNNFYDIVVFSSDICNQNKKTLINMLPRNFSLRFFDVKDGANKLFGDISLSGSEYWSIDMYYRVIIPLVMDEYTKVLYLDCDILFKKDIEEMFEINFDDKSLLAISDTFNIVSKFDTQKERKNFIKEALKLTQKHTYFNSGVLMFNVLKLNSKLYLEKIKRAFFELKELYYPDQDILNFIFKDDVKIISQKWNLQYHLPYCYKENLFSFDKKLVDEYICAFKNPSIIHFTSRIKPWNNKEVDFSKEFLNYASKTSFYSEIQEEINNSQILFDDFYKKLLNSNKVFLWGASVFLRDFLDKYENNFDNILGIIDINSKNQGSSFGKYKIYSPEILKTIKPDEIILTILNSKDKCYNNVKLFLKENGYENINLTSI